MIYTVTFNPSLDYVVKVDNFAVGEINRTQVENIYPGGKGINVSLVLQNLGLQSISSSFSNGPRPKNSPNSSWFGLIKNGLYFSTLSSKSPVASTRV